MLNRTALLFVAGAATFALSASAASAQDTTKTRPRSTKVIPVVKTSPGEVTMPRVDTVTVYRTDTLQLQGRVDTVNTTTVNTVYRVDTVTKNIPFVLPQIGGLYFGVGAGSSLPAANFNDSDHPGWNVSVPFGYDPYGSHWGIRFNAGYGNYEPHTWVKNELDNAQLWNFDGDLKLRFLSGTPRGTRVTLYGLGGGTYNRFKDILETNRDGITSIGDAIGGFEAPPLNPDHSWHSGWGWNAGAGLEVGKGRTNVFLESRFNRFSGENTMISHVPVVLGVTWY
jgi:opacity protein-like surface antigen